MSESKTRKRLYASKKPQIIDVSASQQEPSTMMSTAEQLETLAAIQTYNEKLPKRMKGKGELPPIITSNVGAKMRKEGVFYRQIGIVDGGETTNNYDRYSLSAKQRTIQRAASQQKIDTLRTAYGNLIGAPIPKVFNPEPEKPPPKETKN